LRNQLVVTPRGRDISNSNARCALVSELRKPRPDRHVNLWANQVASASFYLSAITVLELEMGVLQIKRRDGRQGEVLRRWLDTRVLPAFAGRVLATGTAVALRCAKLHVPDRMVHGDALIAATALVHRLIVVTRNTADFEQAGIGPINPWLDQA
jgi:predicted nucleic acid-binding protein